MDHYKRLINRLILPAAVLLLPASVLVLAGSALVPTAPAGFHPGMVPATAGMVVAIAALVELMRALWTYRRWSKGQGERCPECGAPLVAPYLALLDYRCPLRRSHNGRRAG